MKNCESCNKAQANILYYESQGGLSRQVNLCSSCAAEKGFAALGGSLSGSGSSAEQALRLGDLKLRLARAVELEEFEEAARLRDLINNDAFLSPLR